MATSSDFNRSTEPLFCLDYFMKPITALCYPDNFLRRDSPFTDLLLAGTDVGDIHFWNLRTNKWEFNYQLSKGLPIQKIHVVNDNDIVVHQRTGVVLIWKITGRRTFSVTNVIDCEGGFCQSLVIGNQLVVPHDKSCIQAFDLDNCESIKKLVPNTDKALVGRILCQEHFQMGETNYLLVGYESGYVLLFNYDEGKECSKLKMGTVIISITFNPETCKGLVANCYQPLKAFSLDPNTLEMSLITEISFPKEGCQVVRFRHDYRIFATGGWDGKIRLFSGETYEQLVELTEHKEAICDIIFTPLPTLQWETKIFAAASSEGFISLWNTCHDY